ncbi:bifunctional folylpolyglutamate synthase/dihydrofolate synthase [Pseudolysinimonas sp.]|jgi:dihydrofolate synthase/folylpolyglutamate synthase|uniref:bifunctional folylpolyglutamate synthase/dihydrofolate synthase n=1 Tax=Pseudolysinimonas sp. TaxID=2680009 RepID=UPI003783EBC4
MTDEAFDEDELFQREADEVYAELLVRIGEATPQPRLEPTRKVCELLGDPQRTAPVIHITGTNGKTSTSRMIEAILRAAGVKTGLLTSPHLVKVNERIVIDGLPVSNEALVRNWRDIAPYLAIVDAELLANGEEALSYFEALTVLGFAIFADAPVDVMVLEVGMGGEWDSTNVADGQVAVFTPIALDHQARLGNTIAEIATTKGGIIKPAATVVTAMQPLEAMDELRAAAVLDEAEMLIEMVDFALESTTVAVGGQVITVRGRAGTYSDVFLPLYGDYQGQNAAVAIAAVESFIGNGTVPLDPDVVAAGLANATSPGRLQLIGIEPTVFVDAAHNPHGAKALAAAMTEYFDFQRIAVVIAVLGDKDAHGIFAELAPVADRFHVTTSQSDRATPVDDLADIARSVAAEDAVIPFEDFAEAVETARAWAADGPSRAVLITGSITLVGEAIALADAGEWKP